MKNTQFSAKILRPYFLAFFILTFLGQSAYAGPKNRGLIAASKHTVQVRCSDIIKRFLTVVNKLERLTQFDNKDEFDVIHNQVMPDIEIKAIAEAKKIGGIAGGVRFNEVIDESLREMPEVSKYLLELALRRLPYLADQEFNIILSGGVADVWGNVLQQNMHEIERRIHQKLKINIIKLPGGLSFARKDRNQVPAFDETTRKLIKEFPTIFLDDTYSNGGTYLAVKQEIEKNKGKMHGGFVVYDGGKGDVSSLYKSARLNTRTESMGVFDLEPLDWDPQGVKKVAIDVTGTLMLANFDKISGQAGVLLKWMEDKKIEIVLVKNGSLSKDVELEQNIKKAFPYLFFSDDFSDASVLLGSFGRFFVGDKNYKGPRFKGAVVQTIYLGDFTTHGQFGEDQLDAKYFLNRLSEAQLIRPLYDSKFYSKVEQTSQGVAVYDLRFKKVKGDTTVDLVGIYKTKDSKEMVEKLKLVQWVHLSNDEKTLMIERAIRSNNSHEIGAYLEIAKNSDDANSWRLVLLNWKELWGEADKGWQKYLKSPLVQAIYRLGL